MPEASGHEEPEPQPSNSEREPSAFANVYNPTTGEVIPIDPADLERLIEGSADIEFLGRVFGDGYAKGQSASVLLICDVPGRHARVESISLHPPDPRFGDTQWQSSTLLGGEAHYPHWDIERALAGARSNVEGQTGEPLAPEMEALIRQHVYYREVQEPAARPEDEWALTTVGSGEIIRDLPLGEATNEHQAKFAEAVGQGNISMQDLLLHVMEYAAKSGLSEEDILGSILPREQQERLQMMAVRTMDGSDLDGELRRLTGDN